MSQPIHASLASGALAVTALFLLSGCYESSPSGQAAGHPMDRSAARTMSVVRSGTRISVALAQNISSETAEVSDVWHGTVTEEVRSQNESVIPPGSEVEGVVTGVTPSRDGPRGMLDLAVRSIRVNGRVYPIAAGSESVVAGSSRAHNLGAISGTATVSELIGQAGVGGVGGADGDPTAVAATASVVSGSKGARIVLADGTVMTFTVSRTVLLP